MIRQRPLIGIGLEGDQPRHTADRVGSERQTSKREKKRESLLSILEAVEKPAATSAASVGSQPVRFGNGQTGHKKGRACHLGLLRSTARPGKAFRSFQTWIGHCQYCRRPCGTVPADIQLRTTPVGPSLAHS